MEGLIMNDFITMTTPSTGNRYVISDIHGCYKTFKRLVEDIIQLKKTDQLFLLGDYVDRGPSSKDVLDYIMKLLDEGFQLFPLRGNHENDLLEYARGEPRFLLWHLKKHNYPDIAQNGRMKEKYFHFFSSLPYYIELDSYFLVHAGFNFKSEKPFEEKSAMLWMRYFNPPAESLNGKQVIHGHDPVYMKKIVECIKNESVSLPLDNGVPFIGKHKIYGTSQLGKLCSFDLDSKQLYSQRNIDM